MGFGRVEEQGPQAGVVSGQPEDYVIDSEQVLGSGAMVLGQNLLESDRIW